MQIIQYIPTSKLSLHPTNPRLIKDEAFRILCESIKNNKDYFETRPILCNKDMVIFAGNMRYRAAKEIGMTEVPTVIMDISEEKQREIMIRDNVQSGLWNPDILAANFDQKELEDWGIDMSKFGVWGEPEQQPNDDDMPDLLAKTDTKLGDIFKLGDHRVLCGDSTSPEAFLRLLGGKKADMTLTDPPYNVNYGGGMHADGSQSKRKKIANDKMSSENFYVFLRKVMDNLVKNTSGAFYIFMSSSELHNLWKAFTDAGGHWQTYIIWAKDHFTLSRSDYQHKFEPFMYGLSQEKIDEVMEDEHCPIMYGWTKHEWFGGRKQGDVWTYPRPKKSDLHPTMKPVMLCAKAIVNSSREKDIVLDPFLGSGSTLIACEKTGRICYGMEMVPAICGRDHKAVGILYGIESSITLTS